MGRLTSLLLILAASVLGITLLATRPGLQTQEVKFPLEVLNRDTRIILTGDVMLGRSVMAKILEIGDSVYPFRRVADKLKAADIVFVNLENPITRDCKKHIGGFTFCTNPELVEGLLYAGIDIVNLANNHTFNWGRKGFEETKEILSEKGVKWVGDGNLEIIEKRGTKFGFLGFDLTVKDLTEADLDLVKTSNSQVDVLIVAVHWGVEYAREPTKNQKLIAKSLVEAGADVIAGSHPHWVQSMEYIGPENPTLPSGLRGARPVYYSLGNFVFDQMWSEETKKGLVVSLTYREGELKKVEEHPTYMEQWAQPEWVSN